MSSYPRRQFIQHSAAAMAAALVGPARSALAQSSKPVTVVVPFAPAGTTDRLGRMLALNLAPSLQRTVIVDNKPGAGTTVGAAFVARSAPDGDTLLVATSTTLAVNPSLYPKLPYNAAKDFAPIAMIAAVPLVVVVSPALGVKTLEGLVALSAKKAGGLSYGSAGSGSPQHLGVEIFKAETTMRAEHVPYRGSAPALMELLGGQIDFMFCDVQPALPHIKSGKLIALAVSTEQPVPALPGVPTVASSNVPGTKGFDVAAWQSVVAPAGMAPALVERYSKAIGRILQDAKIRQDLEQEGIQPRYMPHSEFGPYIAKEAKRWGDAVRASGATVD
jgi:tripartite-type tricarboxylate transporter receptor subunit TctC